MTNTFPIAAAIVIFALLLTSCRNQTTTTQPSQTTKEVETTAVSIPSTNDITGMEKVIKTDEQWRSELNPEQYRVLRMSGTEAPFTGEYYDHEETGTYVCAGCNHPLFNSTQKYHSGCGWPSFWSELETANIVKKTDTSHGMVRVELRCAKCDGHLGHVFEDGPPPTGTRYCINSASLKFIPKSK